ncbi:MAG: ATP-binding cassette domain-containing protein [Bdellovibrionota bacterium]
MDRALPLVRVEDLRVRRSEKEILLGVSLQIVRGEPFAILGESGSGKTTLLYALLGLIPFYSGRLEICGKNPEALLPRERAELMGLVFQDYALSHMNVLDNLSFAPKKHGKRECEKGQGAIGTTPDRRSDRLLPTQLSGGQSNA